MSTKPGMTTPPEELSVAGGVASPPAPSANGKKKDDWDQPMVLNADYREIPLTIRMKDPVYPEKTIDKEFLLRDCDGPKRTALITYCSKSVKMDPDTGRAVPVDNTEDSDVKIVSFCLHTPMGIPVAEEEIKAMGLPGRVLSKIAMRCMKICDLDEGAEEREKKY